MSSASESEFVSLWLDLAEQCTCCGELMQGAGTQETWGKRQEKRRGNMEDTSRRAVKGWREAHTINTQKVMREMHNRRKAQLNLIRFHPGP